MIVTAEDSRPIGPIGHCTYCGEPIGSPHKPQCVVTWESADDCPFCGSGNVRFDAVDVEAVICGDCGAIGPDVDHEGRTPDAPEHLHREWHDAAVRGWNKRTHA